MIKTYKDTPIMGYPQKTGVYTSTVLNRKRGMNMSDIELVIKIPEEDFERCKKRFQRRIDIMGDAIANGTPLPKGHGRLVDADALKKHKYHDNNRFENAVAVAQIDWADTIIEADKGESEEV